MSTDLTASVDASPAPEALHAHFPGWRPSSHRFDAPGGTLVHQNVVDAVAAYMASPAVTNDGGGFAQSLVTDEIEESARQGFLRLIGTASGATVFGHNMTTLTSLFVRAIRGRIQPGDRILTTALDHEANRIPWRTLENLGAIVDVVPLGADGTVSAESVVAAIRPSTTWVAITAASNVTGATPDLAEICRAAHAAGAHVFVDAVQALAHLRLNVSELGVDALVTSSYKWYGPHVGALWLSETLDIEHLILPEQVPSASVSSAGDHLSLGTWNHEGLVGFAAAAQVVTEWHRSDALREERRVFAKLLKSLSELDRVIVLGNRTRYVGVPLLTFQVRGEEPSHTAARLDSHGIAAWHGSFYASTVLETLAPGLPRAVRLGVSAYTREEDVDALLAAI